MCLRSFTAISAADHRDFTTWRPYALNLPCRNTADGADLMRNQRSGGLLAATLASLVVSACSQPSPPTAPTVRTVSTAVPQGAWFVGLRANRLVRADADGVAE